jgi:uncharacterized protein YdbL (DUF1318 family)
MGLARIMIGTLIIGVTVAGCANLVQVKVDVVDQRTALENQVLGSYEELTGDVVLLASVRSVESDGTLKAAPPLPEGKRAAIRATQRSLYNQDDIIVAKSEKLIGEAQDGYLRYFPENANQTPEKRRAFVQSLVAEENADRKVIYGRIAAINESFDPASPETAQVEVAAIMAGLNRDGAKPGELIETDEGRWIEKK